MNCVGAGRGPHETRPETPREGGLVKLRYFAGLTIDEVALALGISPSTADRHWTYAGRGSTARSSATPSRRPIRIIPEVPDVVPPGTRTVS